MELQHRDLDLEGRQANPHLPDRPQELRGKSSRNVLRRKPSSISQQAESSRPALGRSGSTSPTKWATTSAETRPSIEASLKSIEAYNDIFTRPRARAQPAKESPPIIPELDRYRNKPEPNASSSRAGAEVPHKLATQDLPPPTPLLSGTPVLSGGSSHHRYSGYSGSGYSASPSTRYSESPGPGAYSRDTTPTSMSSQSPGILAPLKTTAPRLRQGSPALTRPPVSSVTRRRAGSNTNEAEGPIVDPQGLPSLRESLTSSSSNSTVKGEGKTKEKKKKKEAVAVASQSTSTQVVSEVQEIASQGRPGLSFQAIPVQEIATQRGTRLSFQAIPGAGETSDGTPI